MLVAYFSPLAPAAVLLLGAFILPFVVARVASRRPTTAGLRYLVAAGVVELAILALLGARLALQVEAHGVEILSEWQFSTADTVRALAVQIDELSLPFSILTLLLLLAAALVAPSLFAGADERSSGDMFICLALGAGASFLFVAANGATMSYAILAFDMFAALYWFRRGHYGLAVARLMLGIVTAVELAVATLVLSSGMLPGGFLLGLILWLRLGGYPFVEANVYRRHQDNNFLVYFVLSLFVTVYLFVRVPFEPWPDLIRWLIILVMSLNGLLAWLAGSSSLGAGETVGEQAVTEAGTETSPAVGADHRPLLLVPLILAQALLILLAVPVAQGVAVAFAAALALSAAALWITPRLGSPSLVEKAWIWPYLPALTAGLTLMGLPFTLGWLTRTSIYRSLLLSAGAGTVLIVALADALALSALVRYWAAMRQDGERDIRRSGVAVLVMVPFLVPGLGPFILSTLINRDLATVDLNQPVWVLGALAGSVIGAIALDYFRPRIIGWLKISPATLTELGYLYWLVPRLAKWADRISKSLLRIQVIVEGQHYMGWALFIAIVGALIILLS